MRTLFVGDVHGCALELRELVRRARPDRTILIGDLFTKGPSPLGVWRVVRDLQAECVLGNHDDYVLRRWTDSSPGRAVSAIRERAPEVRAWLADLPLFLRGPGWIAVHAGVHPHQGPAGTSRQRALTMRRWPDDRDPANPFWYDAGWSGPEAVIFGHDARRGLVRRERGGRLTALGLDTGCVYGGALTGWILERDELIRLPARAVWLDPTRPRRR